MNCIIPGVNLKVVAKALQALAKMGDELYIEAKKDNLTLITLNTAKTVCARFNFNESFFSCYDVNDKELNAENKETLTCKVHMKVLLPLFRGNLEKKLDFLKIDYDTDSDHMMFKMKYKCDDITMVHKLRLMDSETLSIGVSPTAGSNHVIATSSFYNNLLSVFNTSDDEITLEISKAKVIARNYCVGAPCSPKMMRSQINLHSSEFYSYRISQETTINFSLKPFRTAIHFAENFSLNIEFNFETGGKPLSMIMRNATFEVNFIVATLNPSSANDGNTSVTTSAVIARKIQGRIGGPNENNNIANNDNAKGPIPSSDVTCDDLEAMETENWDSDLANVDFGGGRPESNKSVNSSFSRLLNRARNIGNEVLDDEEENDRLRNELGHISRNRERTSRYEGEMSRKQIRNEEMARLKEEIHRKKMKNGVDNNLNKAKENITEIDEFNRKKSSVHQHNNAQNLIANDEDIVPASPESPRTKKAKLVFGRCYDPTFNGTLLGEVLAQNSDSE